MTFHVIAVLSSGYICHRFLSGGFLGTALRLQQRKYKQESESGAGGE